MTHCYLGNLNNFVFLSFFHFFVSSDFYMEKFDSDKRYHVAAIVLIDIKKQTELFLITMSYLNISCCIENCPAVLKIP